MTTQTSPQARPDFQPNAAPPAGSRTSRSQESTGTQTRPAAADNFPDGHTAPGTHPVPPIWEEEGQPAANALASPMPDPLLADPFLALAADVLDDTEKVRIANENRLRQLTRNEPDKDSIERGFGLDLSHPAVARLAAMIKTMKCDSKVVTNLTGEKTRKGERCCLEHDAERNLVKVFTDHPLSPWMDAQKGVGAKQGARLLGAIGDPYMRPELVRKDKDGEIVSAEPARPRLVSELWSYCGLSVIKTPVSGQSPGGTQSGFAGVAPRRQRGQRAGWSPVAKMRVYLVAESCIKQADSPYRKFYDRGRERWADAVHEVPCIRCGPKGSPAPAGSELKDAHKHARAMRLVMKEILRDLWAEAKRIHENGLDGKPIP